MEMISSISKHAKHLKPKWAILVQKLANLIDTNSSDVILSQGHRTASIHTVAEIGRTTSKSEIISILAKIGCHDLTDKVNAFKYTRAPIAGGGLGDIYQGRLDADTLVAIKCARPHTLEIDIDFMQNTTHEIYIWSQCKHRNILELFGIAQFNDQIAIVSPWMANGTLPEYLRQNPSSDRCQLCAQVATGLAYLHETGVVHGDIKGPNVLISDDGTAKLADFGNAFLTDYAIIFSRLPVYTQSVRWSAPEICGQEASYSRQGDVYALAMTILEILTGEAPLSHIRNDVRIVYVVAIEKKIPSRPLFAIPTQSRKGDTLWSFLERCWAADPKNRPSVNEARDALNLISREDLMDETTISPEYAEMFKNLLQHGCRDLTSDLDQSRCHKLRVASDEPFSHRGVLRDGTQVSLRSLVTFVDPSIPSGQQGARNAAAELVSWTRCNHNNIMPLLGIAIMGNQIVLVYSWVRTTTVVSYLFRHSGANRCLLCLELARGISYLHEQSLLQRGMDATSVRVSEGGTIVLIACSNVMIDVHRLQLVRSRRVPELKDTVGSYGFKSDIYALGMMLFEVITDRGLLGVFQTHPEPKSDELPARPEQQIPSDSRYGDNLWRLLNQCWASDPGSRPNASTVVEQMEFIDDEGLRSGSINDASTLPAALDSVASMISLIRGITGHVCPVLDIPSISERPFSKGEFCGFYMGKLGDDTVVSAAIRERSSLLGEEGGIRIVKELAQELHAWSKHDHVNILKLLGIAEVRDELAVITPWIEGGTMPSYLEAAQTDVDFSRMSTQIAEGVAYLHDIGVVHGDIYGGNVWVGEGEIIKLCNFDSAYMRRSLRRTAQDNQPRFSVHWKAPELFQEDVEVNEETDVWALGMTILECITGRVPLEEMREDYVAMRELTDRRYRPKRPIQQIPLDSPQGDTLWDLLTRCWAHAPSDRPTAEEVRDLMRTITSEGLVPFNPTSPVSANESHDSWHSAQENE